MQLQPPSLNQMPVLPELQLNLSQGDEDDDAEEEKNMMTILMKLKSAQSSMNESRKRKKSKQLSEDALLKYTNDAKDLLAKNSRRWNAKFNNMNQKSKKLKIMAEEGIEKVEQNKKMCVVSMEKYKPAVESIVQALKTLEKDCANFQSDSKEGHLIEISKIRAQVTDRVNSMRDLLMRTYNQAAKDDRFTKVIKSFLVNF